MVHTPFDPVVNRMFSRMLEAIDAYEDAKKRFAWRKAELTEGLTGMALVDAEGRAASDARLVKAGKDAVFYCQEAIMYATVVQALKG